MKKNHSCALLGSDVDGAEVEKIGVRIVAVDLEDFGNELPAGPSLYVDDDVEGIGDICLNRTVWNSIPLCKTQLVKRDSPCLAELA
jgi:hypothetical protein